MLGACWGGVWFSKRACFKGIWQRTIGEDTWHAPLAPACMCAHPFMCRHQSYKCVSSKDRVWMRRQKIKMVRLPVLTVKSGTLALDPRLCPLHCQYISHWGQLSQNSKTVQSNMTSLLHPLNLRNVESMTQKKPTAILKHNLWCQWC